MRKSALVLLSVLAACAATETVAAADTLDRVARDGAFRLGYRTDAPPFAFRNKDGSPAGYSVELCARIANAVAAELKRDLTGKFIAISADDRFDKLEAGEVDMLCGPTTVTMTRREKFDFSLLTFVTGGTLLVRAGDAQSQPESGLAQGKLGVLDGTTGEEALRELVAKGEIPGEIVIVESHTDGVRKLKAAEIDGYFGDRVVLLGLKLSDEKPDSLAVSDRFITLEPYALAMRRGDGRLRLIADRTLATLYRSGEIARIFERWMPGGKPSPLLRSLYLLQAIPE